jgi:hypothetical protein
MKRILSLFLCICVLLSFVSCHREALETEPEKENKTETTENQTATVTEEFAEEVTEEETPSLAPEADETPKDEAEGESEADEPSEPEEGDEGDVENPDSEKTDADAGTSSDSNSNSDSGSSSGNSGSSSGNSGSSSGNSGSSSQTAGLKKLLVGYARSKVNPKPGVGLGGYGNQNTRLSNKIVDDLMLTCTALSDGTNTVLLFSSDHTAIGIGIVNNVCNLIEKNYGIPKNNVIINATHSHSAPSLAVSRWTGVANYLDSIYYTVANTVAGKAIRDLEEATVWIGRGYTDQLNHVRRYVSLVDGSYLGKNLSSGQNPNKVAHETQADNEMQIVKFDRKSKKDVVLCNWQCHPTGPGAADSTDVSSDWIHYLRATVEAEAGVHFSYHQGAAGNIGQSSPIQGEKSWGGSRYKEHGREIAKTALSVLNDLTPINGGKVQATRISYVAEYKPEILDKTQSKSYSNNLTLTVLTAGDLAFGSAPMEMHDTLGKDLKEDSPFKMTFMCAYSNGTAGYMPASFAYANGGYEVTSTNFKKGTGEIIVSKLVSQLNTFYKTRY